MSDLVQNVDSNPVPSIPSNDVTIKKERRVHGIYYYSGCACGESHTQLRRTPLDNELCKCGKALPATKAYATVKGQRFTFTLATDHIN